jgi:hypothetical protein
MKEVAVLLKKNEEVKKRNEPCSHEAAAYSIRDKL